MKELLKIEKKLVPEVIDLMLSRYRILRTIADEGTMGRRALASSLGLGERTIRTEVEILKKTNLISVHNVGMNITEEGKAILESLKEIVFYINGLSDIEESVREKLNIKKVIIVSGDSLEDESVKKELGETSARYLRTVTSSNSIIAVTGGSTVKCCIDNVGKSSKLENVLVLPARGGIGGRVERQANTLAATLAEKFNGRYELLHIPDNFSDEKLLEEVKNERSIKKVLEGLHKCSLLLFGIGLADKMAQKRGLSKNVVEDILSKGAVGEAFGYYFNRKGEVVYSTPTIGLKEEDIWRISTLIAVAAGKNKAEAIVATLKNKQNSVLITDEGTARKIMNIL